MNRKRALIASVVTIFLLTATSCNGDSQEVEGAIRASGFVEGRSITIVSTLAGTIDLVQVDQGDEVEADQELFRLEDTLYIHLYDQAQAGVNVANAGLKALEGMPAEEDMDNGQAVLSISEAKLEEAVAALELLESSYFPQDPPDAELHAAESAIAIAEAGVELAKAQLDQIEAGPVNGELRMAEALLREAEAQMRYVERQMEDLSLKSPTWGIVNEILVHKGETVLPGSTVARVLDPSYKTVKIYVPEQQFALIRIGDNVGITADAYPEEVFIGSVLRIADRAQFTPTLVLTDQERVKLVFEVEVLIEDGLDELKPGTPVDVVIQT